MQARSISPHFDDWLHTCFIYALKCIRALWCTELCGVVFLGSALLLLANTAFLSIKRWRLVCLNTERADHYPHCLGSQFQQEKHLKVGHDYGIPLALQSTIYEYQIEWHRVRNLMFLDPCIIVQFIEKNPTKCKSVSKFIIPFLYEVQHVSGDTPPIIRSLKLH